MAETLRHAAVRDGRLGDPVRPESPFLRPFDVFKSDRGYLNAARGLKFLMGMIGTMLGWVSVYPDIKSLFDTFLAVIGFFMGVLVGLFALGGLTTRVESTGAITGTLVGAIGMYSLWDFTSITGYLYTSFGITNCFVVGYLASLASSGPTRDLTGMTIHTLLPETKSGTHE